MVCGFKIEVQPRRMENQFGQSNRWRVLSGASIFVARLREADARMKILLKALA